MLSGAVAESPVTAVKAIKTTAEIIENFLPTGYFFAFALGTLWHLEQSVRGNATLP